ncbi:MAG: PEP/pyruvate-binding domain-containing protein [bacterium]
MPTEVASAVVAALAALGAGLAVRSSAVAEDGLAASFAGLHDTSLGVVGAPAVLEAVRRCWRSLHSERAVAWRRARGLAPARMAVVVQRMVAPLASGCSSRRIGERAPQDVADRGGGRAREGLVAGHGRRHPSASAPASSSNAARPASLLLTDDQV